MIGKRARVAKKGIANEKLKITITMSTRYREKVQRLKLRNEAVENLFIKTKFAESCISSDSSRRKTDSQTTIDKYSSQHKEIMVLRKQLEQREDMEKKIHHLEGRLLSAAKARGKEKLNSKIRRTEGRCKEGYATCSTLKIMLSRSVKSCES